MGSSPAPSHKERFPYNTTDFIFLAFTLCLRFGLLNFSVVKKEKIDESKRETFMGRYVKWSNTFDCKSNASASEVRILPYPLKPANERRF